MQRFVKSAALIVAPFLLAGLIAGAAFRIDRPLRLGVNTVAHELCSKTFISGLDPHEVFAESLALREGPKLIARYVRYEVDPLRHEVRAELRHLGLVRARAVFYPGLGCIAIHGAPPADLPNPSQLMAARSNATAMLPDMAGPEVVETRDKGLQQALTQAFTESDAREPKRTKAVVVVRDGRIIAERYAPGFGVDTPILGFSLTKSMMNALVGILVMQGQLKITDPAPIPEWSASNDPRRAITIEQLMRMTSGLDLDEEDAGLADPSDRMLYLERDMATYARSAKLMVPPGTRFAYSSASTQILSSIVRAGAGPAAIDALEFADRELFAPLGMRHVTVEVDSTGTMIGCNDMFASARDWARLGLLYVNDGIVGDRRILPSGWIDYSTAPTLGTAYGAGFWTARGKGGLAEGLRSFALPSDSFLGSGNLGQRLLIIPSQHLVIVRLGDATGPTNDAVHS
ncbi:MAG TPA: serine hydrolase [Steroidobacteraceae bacterium]|jgi:CubicO group peptidase (beta-lactamase class C family)|nr:serine hydrolase [Steroidobacteraceae bacterium]